MKKIIVWIVAGIIILCAVVGIITFLVGPPENPPVVQEPAWDSMQTRELAKRACFDCHSNETVWPWYSRVIPAAWLIRRDVSEGRSKLNFSDWRPGEMEVEELNEVIAEGEMPPFYYVMMHPTAKMSQAEKETLAQGLSTLK
jgi:hypothetical protein